MRIISKIPVREYYPEILNGTDPYMDYRMNWRWGCESSFPVSGFNILDSELVLAEMEPVVRRIRWSGDHSYSYEWQFPYLQFMYCDGWLGVAASSKPWQPPLPLYTAPFPNVYLSGRVCQDHTRDLEDAVAIFFGSHFETPMNWTNCRDFATLAGTYNLRRGYVQNSIDLSNFWQENPNFILDFDWSKMGEVGKFESGTAISFLYNLQTGTFD